MDLRLLVAGLIIVLACGGTDRSAERPPETGSVRDSAGVRLVTHNDMFNASVDWWTIDTIPDLRIGDIDTQALHRVAGALLVGETLLVADGSSRELRMFDFRGKQVRVFGGRGEGPGEFASIGLIDLIHGDSIAVYDPMLRRATVYSVEGVVGDTRIVEPAPEAEGELTVAAFLGDGVPVLQTETSAHDAIGTTRFDNWVYTRIGESHHQIGVFPGREYYFNPPRSSGAMVSVEYGPAPMGAQLHVDAGEDAVYIMDSDDSTLRVYARDGRAVMNVDNAALRIPVTPQILDAYLNEQVQGRDADVAQRLRQAIHDRLERETLPTMGGLFVSPTDEIWIQSYQVVEADPHVYVVVAPDGAVQKHVHVPAGYELLWAQSDRLVLLSRNDLDVEAVSVFRLVPRR